MCLVVFMLLAILSEDCLEREHSGENCVSRNELVGLISSWTGLERCLHYVTCCENY